MTHRTRMFPEKFEQRILNQNYLDAAALMSALGEPSPVSIRVNRSKWNRKPGNSRPVAWCRDGYHLAERPSFTADPLFHSGCYYPQEASGMFLEQVLLQTAGSLENLHVLDLCGAPGGKSILVSDLLGMGSLLVANDVIRQRAYILSETISKWGSGNTIVTSSDPADLGRLHGYFDIILVDAPCSGEGMFRTDIAVSEWTPEKTLHCAERQKRILADIWPSLRENGLLIYSTCTFNPAENEENIEWLTRQKYAEVLRIDLESFPEVTEISYNGVYGYGFYPGKATGEGFFISVVRKTGKQDEGHARINGLQEVKPEKPDIKIAAEWTFFRTERIIRWKEELIALPCDPEEYLYLVRNLRIIKSGTRISAVKKGGYIPTHDLALSSGLRKGTFHRHELTYEEAISYLRRDNLIINDMPEGWNILSYRDINLGFVKNLGKRINNYFPIGWRIRLDPGGTGSKKIMEWE